MYRRTLDLESGITINIWHQNRGEKSLKINSASERCHGTKSWSLRLNMRTLIVRELGVSMIGVRYVGVVMKCSVDRRILDCYN
jgi:hypothetical protein